MRRCNLLFFLIFIATITACQPEGNSGSSKSDPTLNDTNVELGIGVDVVVEGNKTTETGESILFKVRLTSQPSEQINVDIICSNNNEGMVNPVQLSFTETNYQTFQEVTVTGIDDNEDDGDQIYNIQLIVSSDSFSETIPNVLKLTNIDDDTPGLNIGDISGATTEEGGQATFTLRLRFQPIADVTVSLASSDTNEAAVEPAFLNFTPENWDINQTVTVTGIDDDLIDGDQIYSIYFAEIESADLGYDSLVVQNVGLINTDDDSPGFTVGPVSGDTTEAGGQATFSVKLYCEPVDDVTIAISTTNSGEGIVSPTSLTFTPMSWDIEQTVTITGQDDDVDDDDKSYTIELAAASSLDTDYHGLDPNDADVINTDDDTAGFTIGSISGDTTEWGLTATFTARLNSEPTADVAIDISSSDPGEGTASTAQLTFTPANWDTDQTVTVTGANDNVADRDVIYSILLAAASSNDNKYDGENPPDVSVTNIDNEKIPDGGQAASYTATFGEDNDYTFHSLSYANNGDGTVTDNVTGLMWQRQDDDNTYNFADAISYCSILNLGGYSDWRLATAKELISISDFGRINPSIDPVFVNTNLSRYWSSTSAGSQKFFVIFQNPTAVPSMHLTDTNYVRCVRGEQSVIAYVNNGTTVTATNTGLIWQKGEGGQRSWEAALTYCEGLSLGGQNDWRLPNAKELHSLVDPSFSGPSINTTFFPGATSLNHWSSSTVLSNTSMAYNVIFSWGSVHNSVSKTTSIDVRCVRGGQ